MTQILCDSLAIAFPGPTKVREDEVALQNTRDTNPHG